MPQRERTGKRKKGIRQLVTIPAAGALTLALMLQTGFAAPLEYNTDGTVRGGSVTVETPASVEIPASVIYDLYPIASAEPVEGEDAYTFDFGSFTAGGESYTANIAENTDVTAAALHAFAQDMAAEAQKGTITPLYTNLELERAAAVPAGLYLIILHDAGEDYWKEGNNGEVISTAENGRLAFVPVVVSVPNRPLGGQEEWDTFSIGYKSDEITGSAAAGRTDEGSEWVYDVVMTAKAAEVNAYGSVQITKTLTNYETMPGRTEPGTFVFRVTAHESEDANSPVVYSNVASVVLTGAGASASTRLDKIPVGSFVTVEEIYAGPDYTLAGAAGPVEVIADDPETEGIDMISVSFTNAYDNTHWNGGGSVGNHFGAVETNGNWSWDDDSTIKTMADNSGVESNSLFVNDIQAE